MVIKLLMPKLKDFVILLIPLKITAIIISAHTMENVLIAENLGLYYYVHNIQCTCTKYPIITVCN